MTKTFSALVLVQYPYFLFLCLFCSQTMYLTLSFVIFFCLLSAEFFSMIRAYLHKKQLLRRRHIQSITILQHMLVNCFKAQSFRNYNLAKNKMQPTSFRKRGGISVNTKTHHLSIPHFTEREENLNFPSILFKIVFFFPAHFFSPCPHCLEQAINYQSSQVCGVSFRVISITAGSNS